MEPQDNRNKHMRVCAWGNGRGLAGRLPRDVTLSGGSIRDNYGSARQTETIKRTRGGSVREERGVGRGVFGLEGAKRIYDPQDGKVSDSTINYYTRGIREIKRDQWMG